MICLQNYCLVPFGLPVVSREKHSILKQGYFQFQQRGPVLLIISMDVNTFYAFSGIPPPKSSQFSLFLMLFISQDSKRKPFLKFHLLVLHFNLFQQLEIFLIN